VRERALIFLSRGRWNSTRRKIWDRTSNTRRGEEQESRLFPTLTDDIPIFSVECQAKKQNFDIDIPLTYKFKIRTLKDSYGMH